MTPALASFTCSDHGAFHHDVAGADGATSLTNTNVDGVSGDVYVPDWTTTNLRGQEVTVADVQMLIEDSAKHFFQLGWYVGAGPDTGLPFAGSPQGWFAEGLLDQPEGESLTWLSVSMTPGVWHNFKLVRDGVPTSPSYLHYLAYVDGALAFTSTLSAAIEGTPSVVGETNWDCADMWEHAATSLGQATLKGHHAGATWNLWQQHFDYRGGEPAVTPNCWSVGRINGYTATSSAFDTC